MKRIDIEYGGGRYSVSGRELGDLQREIDAGMRSDEGAWLLVNSGEGRARPAYLSLTRGTAIMLSPIADEQPETSPS